MPVLPVPDSPVLSFDNILTICGFIVLVTLYISNSRTMSKLLGVRLDGIDSRMDDFSTELRKLADIAMGQARMEERMLNEGRRVDEIQRQINHLSEKINEE